MRSPSPITLSGAALLVSLSVSHTAMGAYLEDGDRFRVTIPETGAAVCIAIPAERSSPKECGDIDLEAARATVQTAGTIGDTIGLAYVIHPRWAATIHLRRQDKPGVEFEQAMVPQIAEMNARGLRRRDDIRLSANAKLRAELFRVNGVQVYLQNFDVLPGPALQVDLGGVPPQRWIMHYIPTRDAMYSILVTGGDFDAEPLAKLADALLGSLHATPATPNPPKSPATPGVPVTEPGQQNEQERSYSLLLLFLFVAAVGLVPVLLRRRRSTE